MSEDAGIVSSNDPVVVAPVESPAASEITAQNVAVEAPAEKPVTPAPEELTPEQVAKRNQNRLDRKLDKAYKERAVAQARADHLAQENERLRQSQQPAIPPSDPAAPTIDQFSTIEDFVAARDAFTELKAIEKHEARQLQARNEQHLKVVQSNWEERLEKAIDKNPDINPRLSELKPNTALTMAIMESEIGPEIANYLLSNPAEDKRIGSLPPVSQIRAIGLLEAKILAEPAKAKVPPDLPTPVKPVGGASAPSTKAFSEVMDQDEFEKRRTAYLKSKGRR